MEIFVPLVIAACFIVFLFCLFVLSKDDFLFLKKNITLEQVFNIAFVAGLVGLFVARSFYVIFNFAPGFVNPLVFLLHLFFSKMHDFSSFNPEHGFNFFKKKFGNCPRPFRKHFYCLLLSINLWKSLSRDNNMESLAP